MESTDRKNTARDWLTFGLGFCLLVAPPAANLIHALRSRTFTFNDAETALVALALIGVILVHRRRTAVERRSWKEKLKDMSVRLEQGRAEVERGVAEAEEQRWLLQHQADQLVSLSTAYAIAGARFEELFQGMPAACVGFDSEGTIYEWNRGAVELFGLEAHEVLQRPMWDHMAAPAYRRKGEVIIRHIFAGNDIRDMEWEYPHPSGEVKIVLSNVFPLRTPDGAMVGGIAACQDISDRRAIERRHRMLSKISEIPSSGILITDPQRRIVFANETALSITGRTGLELLGIGIDDLLSMEPDGEVAEGSKTRLQTHREISLVKPRGEKIWLEVHLDQICDERGTVEHYISILTDVTDRKRAEDLVRANEALFKVVIDSLHEGLVVQDVSGKITVANRAAGLILDIDHEDLIGTSYNDARWKAVDEDGHTVNPDEYPSIVAFNRGESLRNRIMALKAKDGQDQWLNINGVPLYEPDATEPYAVLTSFTDITEKRRQEARIFKQMEATRQVNSELKLRQKELQTASAKLVALATTDGLTGLYNHRAFLDRLESLLATATPDRFSLIIGDVDDFKTYNDSFGHTAGDEVLKRVAHLLSQSAGTSNFVARHGGEEFAIILPSSSALEAKELAQSVCDTISHSLWPYRNVTMSLGVTTFTVPGTRALELVEAADRSMYAVKRQGRNGVRHSADLDDFAQSA